MSALGRKRATNSRVEWLSAQPYTACKLFIKLVILNSI